MKRFLLNIFLVALIGAAIAQPRGAPLLQLDRQLEIARYLVQQQPDAEAEEWLRQAEKLRQDVDNFLADKRPQLARSAGQEALVLVRQIFQKLMPEALRQLRDEVNALAQQAKEVVPQSDNSQAKRLLQEAQANSDSARVAAQEEDFRRVFTHLRAAKLQLERSLALVDQSSQSIDDQLVAEQARFVDLLARAESSVAACTNAQAKKLMSDVKNNRAKISTAQNSGDKTGALDLYYESTRLLLRAIDLCRSVSGSPQERAAADIHSLGDLLTSIQTQSLRPRPLRNRGLLRRATRLHTEAQNAYDNGNYGIATDKAGQAKYLLSRMRLAESSQVKRAEQELNRLAQRIRETRGKAAAATPRGQRLLEAAGQCAADAQSYMAAAEHDLALQSILAGNRLLVMLESATATVTRAQAEEEIRRLSEKIGQAKEDDADFGVLDAAETILARAQKAFAENNFEVVLEYARLGLDLLQLQE